jgi:hypothetical protein
MRVRLVLGCTLLAMGTCAVVAISGYLPLPTRRQTTDVWYIDENIQYFPPGPEFKLSREAAAMKAYKADLEAQQGVIGP